MPPVNTPMMQQYLRMKEQHPDCILMFRLGDFYEMFNEDARLVSKELDLTLTSRDRGKPEAERTPMCGVPYHSADAYIARLIAKGYKVAICEQMEDPATAKGLVDRDIIRIVTPGTVMNETMLEEGRNNFICALYRDSGGTGACFCDLSTGECAAGVFSPEEGEHLYNELGRYAPREAVLSDGAYSDGDLVAFLSQRLGCRCENGGEARFRPDAARALAEKQFAAGLEELPAGGERAIQAAGGLLAYLYETQKTDLGHIAVLTWLAEGQYMELDLTARRNLELTETLRSKEKKGSLLWVLDQTKTPMAGAAPPLPRRHLPAAGGGGGPGGRGHSPAGADRRPAGGARPGAAHRPHRLRLRRGPGPDLPLRRAGEAAPGAGAARPPVLPPAEERGGGDGRPGGPAGDHRPGNSGRAPLHRPGGRGHPPRL